MGTLKNLTEEYFGNKMRVEDVIKGVKYHHKFTDKNGTFHDDGYFIEDGNYKTLQKLVDKLTMKRKTRWYSYKIDFNDIDVSNMESLKSIFGYEFAKNEKTGKFENIRIATKYNFDITGWDVSHVRDMSSLFSGCHCFDGNVSKWDVSNVEDAEEMFKYTFIEHDITTLKFTKKLKKTRYMFCFSNFNQDISKWDISNVDDFTGMFDNCSEFDQDLSEWKIKDGANTHDMFRNCPIKEEYKPKGV